MEIVRKRYNRVENMYAKRCRRRISFFFSVRDVGCTKHRPNGTSQVVPGTLSNMILKYLSQPVFGHLGQKKQNRSAQFRPLKNVYFIASLRILLPCI